MSGQRLSRAGSDGASTKPGTGRQQQERRATGGSWVEQGLVFTTEIGTPLEPRNVLRRFEQLARRAGLPGVSLHTLRHTAASLLLAAGTHTKVMQEHLGHSSYAITADHLQPRHAGTAARGLAVDPHRP
ncbi:tyrosine-type recombinase/integrase [Modestobacter sp. KNN46-3]|uniref:tyrosine-type recombinase/integrase n=1 Tax=Modestobacter sp. KNN46-3 TaxID=2711218 RepID=UPI0019D12621|nr:tyrosine-type recombinase/integrase [Modestobacter sp. KNN46-3]